ncbi:hypothetical protein D3C73_985600 [compost metagenome]
MLCRQLTQGFKCPVRGWNIAELLGILQQRVHAAAVKKRLQPAVFSCSAQVCECTVTFHTIQTKQLWIESLSRPAEAYRNLIFLKPMDRSIRTG